nr:hypothetical protein [Limnohabitans sp. Rim8]
MRVIPVAERDGMLRILSGAHAPFCDTHDPWQDEELVLGGRLQFEIGSLRVPRSHRLGVSIDPTTLERLHDTDLHCRIRNRDHLGQIRRYDPSFKGKQPRF